MCISNDFLSKKDSFFFSQISRVTDPLDQGDLYTLNIFSLSKPIGLLEKNKALELTASEQHCVINIVDTPELFDHLRITRTSVIPALGGN